MVKVVCVKAFCLLLMVCALGPASRAISSYNQSQMNVIVQDQAGTVWTTGFVNNASVLYRWQDNAWQPEMLPEVAGCQSIALARGDDGAIYSAWQTQNQGSPQCLITVHRAGQSRVLAHFPIPVVPIWAHITPGLWAGRKGDVWFSGADPVLWHVSPEGNVESFPLTPDQRFVGQPAGLYMPHQTSSLVDGQGRRWFWQDNLGMYGNMGSLRGVLIWDGKVFSYHATLPGIPDCSYSTLTPLDSNHLWLAVGDQFWPFSARKQGGLYRIDTRTYTAAPVAPPEKGAFQNVTQIFRANGDWYVSEVPPGDNQAVFLWRQRSGRWQKCLSNIEWSSQPHSSGAWHCWLAVPNGVWLGVTGGVWWIPANGSAAVQVDWRRGLPLSSVTGLFRLADGKILAFGSNTAYVFLPLTAPPLSPANPEVVMNGMGQPAGLNGMVADSRGHLWAIRRRWQKAFPLDEWDGKRWRTHVAPLTITSIISFLACDTQNRVWLNTMEWHSSAPLINGIAIYDSTHDTWLKYDSLPDALKAAAMLHSLKLLPNNQVNGLPILSGDGRATYAEGSTIYLFDGNTWHHWKAREIKSDYPSDNLVWGPLFNNAGRLEVGLPEDLWQWTSESGWQQTGRQAPGDQFPPLPLGGPFVWGQTVTDVRGARWLTWQGDLYETWHGLWAKQTALSGSGSPFWDGRSLGDVLRDSRGRLFFVTTPSSGGYPDLVVWQPHLPPAPEIKLLPRAEDAVTLRFSSPVAGPHWFVWRINGGEWSAPQKTTSVALRGLPRGDYRVEALALDKNLQSAAQPSVAAFTIRVSPAAQIARWAHVLLVGGDDARETAVAGLVKQPDLALPALRAARAGASEDGLWWLDAAIGQIEDANAANNNP